MTLIKKPFETLREKEKMLESRNLVKMLVKSLTKYEYIIVLQQEMRFKIIRIKQEQNTQIFFFTFIDLTGAHTAQCDGEGG